MQNIESVLKTHIQNDDTDLFVVIVPTDSARLNRQRELINYHPNRAVAGLQVYDIQNFIQRLYNQVHPARTQISSGIQNLWLQEITGTDSNQSDTHRYDALRPNLNLGVPDSTLSLIANTIDNLKEMGETAQDIRPDTPTKSDLSRIYSRYEARLQTKWIDDKGKHLYLVNHFRNDFFKRGFPRVKLVVVEGFSVLSKSDIKILTKIAEIPDIEMWFRTDCLSENPELFSNINDLVSEFRAADCNIDTDYERDDAKHRHFAGNLFRTDIASSKPIDITQQIITLKPTDRTEEVEQIAHLIQQHVSSEDCNLGDICVAYYNLGQYQQRIAEIFPTFGIPYSLSETIPLTKSEVVKAIFSRLSSRQEPIGDIYFSDVNRESQSRMFNPNEFQKHVSNLLSTGEVIKHILNPILHRNSKIVEGEVNALQAFKRIVRELCAVLKSEQKSSDRLDYYINKLHYIAKHTHYQNTAQTKSESVKIVTLGELRSLEYDTVFLGDFVDGGFPPTNRPDPLLPERPYRTEDEQLYDNRFLFYRVLKSFRERLYLLVPQRENVSELIPSLFLTQLKEIVNIEEKEITNPTQRSVTGFLSAYGKHAATTTSQSNQEFPKELEGMRPLIDHVVSIEKIRENTHEHSAYKGVLNVENLSKNSQERLEKLRENEYSITDLETYAKCPFQYFVDKVLDFRVRDEEEDDEPSALEKGSLIHNVLCTFYMNRRKSDEPSIAECSNEEFEQARQQLNEILDSISESRRKERSDVVHEDNLFWQIEMEKQRVALHKWLDAERDNDLHVKPTFFEVSFGPTNQLGDPELSCLDPIRIGDINLRGRIDRVDVGAGSFNIIDYKTGSSEIKMQDILEGRSLQIPIYLQIAQQLLEQNGKAGLEPTAGLYHKIRLDEFKAELGIGNEEFNDITYRSFNGTEWKKFSKSKQLLFDEQFHSRLERVSGYVQQYVESISNGIFPIITHVDNYVDSVEDGDKPITPKDPTQPCSYCAYKRICRVGAFVESFQTDT